MIDPLTNPPISPETDAAVSAWMRRHGWKTAAARWEMEPETGFYVWEEEAHGGGRTHALWIEEAMVQHLTAEELVQVLNSERMVEEIRVSFKVRIEERGAEYRVSPVPRKSGGFRRLE
jgi:hypothetical protein